MTAPISLATLKQARAGMSQGEWWIGDNDGAVCAGPDGPDAVYVGPVDWRTPNLCGMLNTHNVADALIEIAEAALAYERSECTGEDTGCSHPAHRAGCAIIIAHATLAAALAKVAP